MDVDALNELEETQAPGDIIEETTAVEVVEKPKPKRKPRQPAEVAPEVAPEPEPQPVRFKHTPMRMRGPRCRCGNCR